MEAPPSDQKRISLVALLFPLLSVVVAMGLMSWQMRGAQQPVMVPELMAAGAALKANNVEQAKQQFEKALSKASDPPLLYRAVMSVCSELGHWDLAREYGERAIQACRYAPNSERAALYETLASCYADGHEPPPQPRAIEYARRAVELAPDDAGALNSLGYILAENVQTEAEANIALGYVNHALNILREQMAASPELLAQVEDSYGWALYKRGRFHAEDYAHAADALRQAVADTPQNLPDAAQKVIYTHLGIACHAAGQIEEARHALQIALLYDPQYPDAKNELNSLPPPLTNTPAHDVTAPTSTTPAMQTAQTPAAPTQTPAVPTQTPAVPTQTPDGKPIFKPLPDNKPPK